MSESDNYYQILGINRNASSDEIKKAYLFKANILHPDRLNELGENIRRKAEEELKKVNIAYDTLKNPLKRSEYDRITFKAGLKREDHIQKKGQDSPDYKETKKDIASEDWSDKVGRVFKYTLAGGVIAIVFCFAIGMFEWGKVIYVQLILALGLIIGFTFAMLKNLNRL